MIVPAQKQNSRAVARHYNDLSQIYLDVWGEHLHHGYWLSGRETVDEAVYQLISLVAQKAQLRAGEKVCDIGCGYGGTARVLAQDYLAEVTAITISRSQYYYALKKSEPLLQRKPHFLLGDWQKNRLPAHHFDVIISIESSEHMPNKTDFFGDIFRLLKPGGRLVVCSWLARSRIHPLKEYFLLEPICREGRIPSLGTAREYKHLLRQAGFSQVNHKDLTPQVKKTWPQCIKKALRTLLSSKDHRRFFLKSNSPNRVFAKTILRIWAAYEFNCMAYGLFTGIKPY